MTSSDRVDTAVSQPWGPPALLIIGTLVLFAAPAVVFWLEGTSDYQLMAVLVGSAGVFLSGAFLLIELRARSREKFAEAVRHE